MKDENECAGGWVGYFSYDTMRYVENKKLPFSKAPTDDRNLADFHLGLYDEVLVFDHIEKVPNSNSNSNFIKPHLLGMLI